MLPGSELALKTPAAPVPAPPAETPRRALSEVRWLRSPVAVQNQTVTRLIDAHSRQIRDRISITDRCNFRCLYCLPETEEAANFYFSGTSVHPARVEAAFHFLTYEEITRVRVASGWDKQNPPDRR